MNIRVDNFHGIQPRVHPTLLADGMAVTAHNCVLESGKLVPLRKPLIVDNIVTHLEGGLESVADAKSLYVWKHSTDRGVKVDFLAFPGVVDFAEGNLADDQYDRVFAAGKTGYQFTDEKGKTWGDSPVVYIYDRQTKNIRAYPISKVPITETPSVSVSSGAIDTSKTIFYEYFFVSWVDELGYESGLSPASIASSGGYGETGALMLNSGMVVKFEKITNVPEQARKIYVYASSAGSESSADGIQFLAERSVADVKAQTGFTVPFLVENLGEAEPGIESPPGDLSGIKFVAGGFYAAFSPSHPHTVMFSDIGIVTSWPMAYRYDVKDNIVALATTGNTVYVLTDGGPWVISGTAPESMTVTKIEDSAACISQRGVCTYKNSVYFVSNEGLMAIVNGPGGTVCTNVTKKYFTKDQWQEKNPSSCLMGQHDGRMMLFFRDRNFVALQGLIIDLNEGVDAITTHDEFAKCLAHDSRTDKLYFVREGMD